MSHPQPQARLRAALCALLALATLASSAAVGRQVPDEATAPQGSAARDSEAADAPDVATQSGRAESDEAGDANSEAVPDPAALAADFERVCTELRALLDSHPGRILRARSLDEALGDPETDEDGARRTVEEFYASIRELYRQRIELIPALDEGTRREVRGNGKEGVRQAKLEFDYLVRRLRYERLAVPRGVEAVQRNVREAPVPAAIMVLAVLAALIVFRLWRRWAGAGIPRLQELARDAWGHRPAARPFSEFLRYVEAVRRPLEWLALSTVLFRVVELKQLREPEAALRICIFWVLLAWFSVNLADAFASRGGTARPEARNKARLRSLRILAAWVVVLGLGLELTRLLTGPGTLHAWVWDLFQVLAVPVAIALLLVWRPAIRQRLEREAKFSDQVAKLLAQRGVFAVIWTTLGGLAYLALLGLRRGALKLVRRSGLGRTLVAEAMRQRMVKSDVTGESEHELDADVRKSWLRGGDVVESAIADELEQVGSMLDRGWKSIMLVGERGSGKSVFLRHLASVRGEEVLVVNCPHGGADEAIAAIGRALELEGQDLSDDDVYAGLKARGVRVIALDDVQRISRPMLGGQAELNLLIERTVGWQDIRVVAAIDAAAWEYFGRLREGTLTGASSVALSAWTEGQIGELLEQRAREVGMELDYGNMRFPRYLLEQDFDTPEEGLRSSYQRILWGEAEGNPEVALRLVVERLVENADGNGVLRLPRSPKVSELDGMTLVELLVLRFILQTDGATASELVAGLRFPLAAIEGVLDTAVMRGLLEENHGRYRVTWQWFRMVSRVLKRKNMLGAAPQKAERAEETSSDSNRRPQMRRVR